MSEIMLNLTEADIELTTYIDTDVILFASAFAVFTNMRRVVTLGALYGTLPRLIP